MRQEVGNRSFHVICQGHEENSDYFHEQDRDQRHHEEQKVFTDDRLLSVTALVEGEERPVALSCSMEKDTLKAELPENAESVCHVSDEKRGHSSQLHQHDGRGVLPDTDRRGL